MLLTYRTPGRGVWIARPAWTGTQENVKKCMRVDPPSPIRITAVTFSTTAAIGLATSPRPPRAARRQQASSRIVAESESTGVPTFEDGHLAFEPARRSVRLPVSQPASPRSPGRASARSVVRRAPPHHFVIRRGGVSNLRPMNTVPAFGLQDAAPPRRQVHVDQELHGCASGTSISSERHAAYDRAAVMSSASRYG